METRGVKQKRRYVGEDFEDPADIEADRHEDASLQDEISGAAYSERKREEAKQAWRE